MKQIFPIGLMADVLCVICARLDDLPRTYDTTVEYDKFPPTQVGKPASLTFKTKDTVHLSLDLCMCVCNYCNNTNAKHVHQNVGEKPGAE